MRLDRYIKNIKLLTLINQHNFSEKDKELITKLTTYIDLSIKEGLRPQITFLFFSVFRMFLIQCVQTRRFIGMFGNRKDLFLDKELEHLPIVNTGEELTQLYDQISSKDSKIRHKLLFCKTYLPKELQPLL
jgi:hypothetical protein